VLPNNERIENVREKSELYLRETATNRKEKWDKKAKTREFQVGEEVLVRKPGLNFKLQDSWEGPFTVYKRNSSLSYGVDTKDRKLTAVHIQLMKKYERNGENPNVNRATSVFEPDEDKDDITDRYAEVKVTENNIGSGEI